MYVVQDTFILHLYVPLLTLSKEFHIPKWKQDELKNSPHSRLLAMYNALFPESVAKLANGYKFCYLATILGCM